MGTIPEWIGAAGAVVAALATIAIAIGAWSQLRQLVTQTASAEKARQDETARLEQQINLAQSTHQDQMEELKQNREATLRPFVIMVRAAIIGSDLQLVLQNMGPGPALHVRVAG